MATAAGKTNRFMELEGLRGIAALMVFVFHFLIIFYPVMFYGHLPDLAPIQHMRFEDNIHGTPLGSLISGSFAVAVFFVLSGFVLSIGFFTTKSEKVIKRLAIKRYPRLMLPALVSVLLAWVYISLNLSHTMDAHAITMSGALPPDWTTYPANIFRAFQEGVINIFTIGSANNYNSVLWTMQYEFAGSFIVFIMALIFGQSNKRWIVYGVLMIGLYNTWFIGFILGMIVADIYVNKRSLFFKLRTPIYSYALLGIGIFLGGYPVATADGTVYQYFSLPWLSVVENQSFMATIGALCVVLTVLMHAGIRKLMASKTMSNFGKYTYSFYLVHQPIIYTLGTGLFMIFIHRLSYNMSVLFAILCTLPIITIATRIFYKFIEQPSVRLAGYFERVYSGEVEFNMVQLYQYGKYRTARLWARIRRQPVEIELETE